MMGGRHGSVVCPLSLSPGSPETLTDARPWPFRGLGLLTAPVAATPRPTRNFISSPWPSFLLLGQAEHLLLGLVQVLAGSLHLLLATRAHGRSDRQAGH